MKNLLTGISVLILSLLITFITFDSMSWYNFGDAPSSVVLIRLIIFFIVVVVILMVILLLVKKLRK